MPSFSHVKKPLIALLVGAPLSLGLVACGSGGEAEEGAASDERSTVTSTSATESEGAEGSAADEPSDESENPEGSDADSADSNGEAGRDGGNADDRDGADAGQGAQGGRAAGGAGAAGGGRSDTAPTVEARETTGDPAVTAEVQAAVQNQFDSAHYANMATLWDHTQQSTCASALESSQQEAKQMMAQELPGEVQGLDVFSLMNDPNVGPVVRQELANQPAPAAPQLNSIDSVEVDGGQATVQVNATTDGQASTQAMNFVNEGGTWKLCN